MLQTLFFSLSTILIIFPAGQAGERPSWECLLSQKALPPAKELKALPPAKELKALPPAKELKALPPGKLTLKDWIHTTGRKLLNDYKNASFLDAAILGALMGGALIFRNKGYLQVAETDCRAYENKSKKELLKSALKKPIIYHCLKNSNRKRALVSYHWRNKCSQNEDRGEDSLYEIENKDGIPTVRKTILLEYVGDPKKHQESLQKVTQATPCIEKLFAANGINLELNIKEYFSPSERETTEEPQKKFSFLGFMYHVETIRIKPRGKNIVNLHTKKMRANSANWTTENAKFKGITAHEIGHLLGLPDRYHDIDCPERPKENYAPDSALMASGSHKPSHKAFLTQDDLEIIIAPLCSDYYRKTIDKNKIIFVDPDSNQIFFANPDSP
ncbi:MAG: hypothetical protein CL678_07050 [Bdellovibrionaceae bacterium]|nr:hypothetical protein [Pseudobdellovibrionaceae bacterium]|tara:strand:- start:128 stop:1288 length:1161 start_codon:yes stop_codon:yes gene_type:complete